MAIDSTLELVQFVHSGCGMLELAEATEKIRESAELIDKKTRSAIVDNSDEFWILFDCVKSLADYMRTIRDNAKHSTSNLVAMWRSTSPAGSDAIEFGQERFSQLLALHDGWRLQADWHVANLEKKLQGRFQEYVKKIISDFLEIEANMNCVESILALPYEKNVLEAKKQFSSGELMDLKTFVNGLRGI